MSVKQSTLFPPPVRDTEISDPLRKYLFSLQQLHPLIEVDTTAGNVVLALPQAGLTNQQTGQSNQNQEIIYVKTSADANTVTITGAQGGSVILAAQYNVARFKSDATSWWLSTLLASAVPSTLNFADDETPGGAINGGNVTFTLAHSPNPPGSLELYYNGLLQKPGGVDYTLVGNTITFVSAPTTGSTLLAWYRY